MGRAPDCLDAFGILGFGGRGGHRGRRWFLIICWRVWELGGQRGGGRAGNIGHDELALHSNMCMHECALRALYLPNWTANWTATLGSTTSRLHWPRVGVRRLARKLDRGRVDVACASCPWIVHRRADGGGPVFGLGKRARPNTELCSEGQF